MLYLLSKHIENTLKNKKINLVNYLQYIQKSKILPNKNNLKKLCEFINQNEKVIFIGKGEDYITAQEASLKLKEISYINSIALPSGELKHGSLALVDENTVVIVIATKKKTLEKNLASASEIKARKGKVALITNLDLTNFQKKGIDFIYPFARCMQQHSSMLSIIPLQQLAIDVCLSKNLSPDKPRNLAKSVTVE